MLSWALQQYSSGGQYLIPQGSALAAPWDRTWNRGAWVCATAGAGMASTVWTAAGWTADTTWTFGAGWLVGAAIAAPVINRANRARERMVSDLDIETSFLAACSRQARARINPSPPRQELQPVGRNHNGLRSKAAGGRAGISSTLHGLSRPSYPLEHGGARPAAALVIASICIAGATVRMALEGPLHRLPSCGSRNRSRCPWQARWRWKRAAAVSLHAVPAPC